MSTIQNVPNPFALMMDPESIFAALARSDRLARLKSQVCHPLDKPVSVRPEGDVADTDAKVEARFTRRQG